MNRKSISLLVAPIVALLVMAVSSNANADDPIIVDVDCDVDDVQDILDNNIFSFPMELKLDGICDGFEITKDNVSIAPLDNSLCPGATVEGHIAIEGARGFKLSCVKIVGPDGGVSMWGGQALLEDVDIIGNSDAGIEMSAHALIEMIGGSVRHHGNGVAMESGHAILEEVEISNNATGVSAENNSYVEFGGGTVMNNSEYGIDIASSSVLDSERLTVSNNGWVGILVGGNSRADIFAAVITGHTRSGLAVTDSSSVRLSGGTIAQNAWNGIFLAWHSTLRVFPGEEGQATEILDNGRSGIFLARDAGAQIIGAYIPPNGNGSAIKCDGREASVDYSRSPMIVKKYVDCRDPGF